MDTVMAHKTEYVYIKLVSYAYSFEDVSYMKDTTFSIAIWESSF